jgi:nucleoside-diphosphate-sugar epimerase
LTGATGFIGAHLLVQLIALGHRVQALTRRPRPAEQGLVWIDGDLDDEAALALLVADADIVIHLAGAVRGARRADFDAVNVVGTRALARAAAHGGVGRVISVSSLAAREPSLSHYAASKRDGEAVLRQFCADATVLRPPAVYGPGERELKPLFDLMRAGVAPAPRGRGRLSLIYVGDVVAALVTCMNTGIKGGTYEIHDGAQRGYDWQALRAAVTAVSGRRSLPIPIPRSVLEVLALTNLGCARVFGYAPMLTPGKVAELFHRDWVVRETAFTEACGWRPEVDLPAGLRLTFQSPPVA